MALNEEFLDLEDFRIRIDASLGFDGHPVRLVIAPPEPWLVEVDFEGRRLEARFTVGYNPASGKPQIGWEGDLPEAVVRAAVDTIVGKVCEQFPTTALASGLPQLFGGS